MLIIIRCRQCNKEGSLPFTLAWDYNIKWCKHCLHNQTETKVYRFCSEKCLKLFVKNFSATKHKWEPIIYSKDMISMSVDADKYIVKIEEKCYVCEITRWREINFPETKLYKEQIDSMMSIK